MQEQLTFLKISPTCRTNGGVNQVAPKADTQVEHYLQKQIIRYLPREVMRAGF
jgi:hypothetical protein